MALPTGATTATILANATIDRYMPARLLKIADKHTVLYKLGRKVNVPKGESKTVSFTRFERLALPTTPIVEGTTPNATPMSTSRVTCVLEQWGAFVTITDIAEMTVRSQPFQQAVMLLGMQAAETVDREVLRQLMSGTQVFFPGAITSRASITATDVPTTTLLRKVRATLKNGGAPFYDGRYFAGVSDPFNMADIMNDSTFVQAAVYQDKGVLTTGEFGVWMGVRWNESNTLPVVVRNTAATATITTPAASGGETAIPGTGSVFVLITGNDASGFETQYGADGDAATAGFVTGDVVSIVTPALPAGITSFNIYVGVPGGAVSTLALQLDRALPSTTYIVSANGVASAGTGITYTASGRVALPAPAASINVHYMFIFGNEWYAVTELEAIKTTRTPAGAQKGDELDLQRSAGWKTMFRACITNQLFGCRIEAESAFD